MLLHDSSSRPLFQDYTLCKVRGVDDPAPWEVGVGTVVHAVRRLVMPHAGFKEIATLTTGELADFMSRCGQTWYLHRLSMTPVDLLTYSVTAIGPYILLLDKDKPVQQLQEKRAKGEEDPLADLRGLVGDSAKRRRLSSKQPSPAAAAVIILEEADDPEQAPLESDHEGEESSEDAPEEEEVDFGADSATSDDDDDDFGDGGNV